MIKIIRNLKIPNKENHGINVRKSIKISSAKNTFPESIMSGFFLIFLLLRILQQHESTAKSNNKINNYINELLRPLLLKHTQK